MGTLPHFGTGILNPGLVPVMARNTSHAVVWNMADSKIESLWNPNLPKWIDRFIKGFLQTDTRIPVLSSLCFLASREISGKPFILCLEADGLLIFRVFITIIRDIWCDDPYALADFRNYIEAAVHFLG